MRQTKTVTEVHTAKGTQFTHHVKDTASPAGGGTDVSTGYDIGDMKTIQSVPAKAATSPKKGIFNAPAGRRNKI